MQIEPQVLASRKIATVMAILDSRNVAQDLKQLIRKEMWSFFDQTKGTELQGENNCKDISGSIEN